MIEALILGVVQGLTEFLPVSSTAHLILFPWFFHWSGDLDSLSFDVALHAGTLIALLACFWRDWLELITKKRRLFLMLVAASFPAALAGLFLHRFVEHTLRNPLVIAVSLILFGALMLAAERMKKERTLAELTMADALLIGLAQAVALIPGVSRSGITISAGLFQGFEREEAARFSFLLSTPVIAGATLLHARKLIRNSGDHNMTLFVVGLTAAALSGYAAIKFLMHYLRNHPLNLFAYYRFALAAIVLAGIWLRV